MLSRKKKKIMISETVNLRYFKYSTQHKNASFYLTIQNKNFIDLKLHAIQVYIKLLFRSC